jgi:GNAT superfamily N-acetyltransferase
VELVKAYVRSLPIDIGYQGIDHELASMPGEYAPPKGALLLARNETGTAVGCIALRPMKTEGCCEMKRLYVVPEARGTGLGRLLVEAIIREAERIEYSEMRLDCLPALQPALALYHQTGFVSIAPYYDTPILDTIFLAKSLRPDQRTVRE